MNITAPSSAAPPSATSSHESISAGITTGPQDPEHVSSTSGSASTVVSFSVIERPTHTNAIIGASVAGAVVLGMILFFFIWRCRTRKPKPESFQLNSSPTIDPFFLFATRPNEKYRRRFTRLSDSTVSLVSSKTASDRTDASSREEGDGISLQVPGQQMEWVLRPTNDPPPGYNS
ncbi:hypothetical protein B0H13DRAFT_2267101 [Mycena leptocephala]|nr:hypothetical protein B0H13DRAFT_2267101 [Mycena leptocephala]